MPTRHTNLFEQVANISALHKGYLNARRLKRKKKPVQCFEKNLGAELVSLEKELLDGTYTPQPYRVFWVDDPKPRLIYAPAFRDVVVQHALYDLVYPIFDRTFIHDSYGCRRGKGTHSAGLQLQKYMRAVDSDSYTLQLDIRKFFYRIDRDRLFEELKKKIKDSRLLALMKSFTAYPDKTGIPIGNLMSQLYSNICLNPLDHFVKRVLKIKHYIRFVDDLILLGLTKFQAVACKEAIQQFLAQALNLELSRWKISPLRKGVNFVGWRTWRKTRFIRKHCLYNFSKRLKEGKIDSLVSILGHSKHTATHQHLCRRIKTERADLVPQFPTAIKFNLGVA